MDYNEYREKMGIVESPTEEGPADGKARRGRPPKGNKPETFSVTFDSDGGTAVEPQTVPNGGKVTKPEGVVKEGHTLDGWVTDTPEEWDFDTPVTGDITLYAKWTEAVADTAEKPTGV
jgi:uncharacterized repeat protein (TIGR02543 family)